MLHEGTRIGADGKRYPIGGDVPSDPDPYRRLSVGVYGTPTEGQVPVWNAERGRLEWGAGGGTPPDEGEPPPSGSPPDSDQAVIASRVFG